MSQNMKKVSQNRLKYVSSSACKKINDYDYDYVTERYFPWFISLLYFLHLLIIHNCHKYFYTLIKIH